MTSVLRRVVTGHDENMRACVIIDEAIDHYRENVLIPDGNPHRCLTNIWQLEQVPASNEGNADTVNQPLTLQPGPAGAVFRTLEIPPDELMDFSKIGTYFDQMSGDSALDHDDDAPPGMHRTATVDFIAVLSGEVWLLLDDGEALLKQGDTAVQRGTNHAWRNRTDKPCILAIVLVATDPM